MCVDWTINVTIAEKFNFLTQNLATLETYSWEDCVSLEGLFEFPTGNNTTVCYFIGLDNKVV